MDTKKLHRRRGDPLIGELSPVPDGPCGADRIDGLIGQARHHVACRPRHLELGRQPGLGRDRRLGAFQQVQVFAAASNVASQHQIDGHRQ
jgi:hypothetical protein